MSFKSLVIFSSLTITFFKPLSVSLIPCKEYPKATPKFLRQEESDKSLCILERGNLFVKTTNSPLAISKLASLFSKLIGFTL